jgi:hypothetical protein
LPNVNKSPERNDSGERMLTNDKIIQKYFKTQMAKITIDGDDESYEARVNQADMNEEEPNEKPIDNITDVMTKSMMGTSTNALDSRLAVADNGKHKRMQMDSGCCGMSMLSSPAYFCYGLADGKRRLTSTRQKKARQGRLNHTASQPGLFRHLLISKPAKLDHARQSGPVWRYATMQFMTWLTRTDLASTLMEHQHHTV